MPTSLPKTPQAGTFVVQPPPSVTASIKQEEKVGDNNLGLHLGNYIPKANCKACQASGTSTKESYQENQDILEEAKTEPYIEVPYDAAILDFVRDKDNDLLYISNKGTFYGLKFKRGGIKDKSVLVGELRDRIGEIFEIKEAWRISLHHSGYLSFRNDPLA